VETETAAQPETVSMFTALRHRLADLFTAGRRKSNDSISGPITPQPDTAPVDIRIPPINTTNRPDSTTAIPSIKVRLQEATTYAPDSSIGDGRTVNGTAVRNEVIDPGPGPGTRAARGLTPAVLRPNPRPEVTILSQPDEAPPEVKILDNPEMVAVEPTSPFRAEPAPQPIPEHLHTGGDGVLEPAAGPTLPEQPAALSHDSTEPPAIVATTGTKAAESFALVSEVDAQEGDLQLHGFQNLQTLIEQDGELDFVQIIKIINPLSDDFRTLIQDTLPGDLISEIKREKIANGPKVTYKLSSAYSADNMTVTLTRGKVEVVESYGNEKQKVSRTYKVEPDPNDQYQKRLYKDGVEVMDSREKQVLWGKFQTLNDGVILYASNMDKAFMQKFPPIQEAIPTQ